MAIELLPGTPEALGVLALAMVNFKRENMRIADSRYRIFISYMHKDIRHAKLLRKKLDLNLCWNHIFIDTQEIPAGGALSDIKPEDYDNLIVVYSKWTLKSWWVGFECGRAFSTNKAITIVSVDDTPTAELAIHLNLDPLDIKLNNEENLKDLYTRICHQGDEKIKGMFTGLKKGDTVSIITDAETIKMQRYGREFIWTEELWMHEGRKYRIVKKFPSNWSCQLDIKGCKYHWPMEWLEKVDH